MGQDDADSLGGGSGIEGIKGEKGDEEHMAGASWTRQAIPSRMLHQISTYPHPLHPFELIPCQNPLPLTPNPMHLEYQQPSSEKSKMKSQME